MTGRHVLRVGAVAVAAASLLAAGTANAKTPTFAAYIVDAAGKSIGEAHFVSVAKGVQVTVNVSGLPPGVHGMHVHEFGSCNTLRDTTGAPTVFGAAGGHYDPGTTGHHRGPDGGGHAGDMPTITVDPMGNGGVTFFDKDLQIGGGSSIVGRAIVIHANGDNFTDTPPNGGAGGRIACGEIGAAHAAS